MAQVGRPRVLGGRRGVLSGQSNLLGGPLAGLGAQQNVLTVAAQVMALDTGLYAATGLEMAQGGYLVGTPGDESQGGDGGGDGGPGDGGDAE